MREGTNRVQAKINYRTPGPSRAFLLPRPYPGNYPYVLVINKEAKNSKTPWTTPLFCDMISNDGWLTTTLPLAFIDSTTGWRREEYSPPRLWVSPLFRFVGGKK